MQRSLLFSLWSFFALFVQGCSSQNNPNTLPDIAVDDSPPRVALTIPAQGDVVAISPKQPVLMRFDESLDLDSLSGNASLYSIKIRDIDSTIELGEFDGVKFSFDDRALNISTQEELITAYDSVTISETVDEDGDITRETKTLEYEKLVTKLGLQGAGRFPLASNFAFVLGDGIKDKSTITRIDPFTGELVKGNYLANEIIVPFFTEDGEWQDTYDVDPGSQLPAGSYITRPKGASTDEGLVITWLQHSTNNTDPISTLLYSSYASDAQYIAGSSSRIDSISSFGELDDYAHIGLASTVGNMAGSSITTCSVWSAHNNPTNLNVEVFVRCSGDDHYARFSIRTHNDHALLTDLSVRKAGQDRLLVSYLYDGIAYFDGLNVSEDGIVTRLDATTSLPIDEVQELIFVNDKSKDPSFGRFIFSTISSANTLNRDVWSGMAEFDADSLVVGSDLVYQGDGPLTLVGSGLDYWGQGIVAWVKKGVDRTSLMMSVYNGAAWESAKVITSVTLGTDLSVRLEHMKDGQTLFIANEFDGTNSLLKAFGYFYRGNSDQLYAVDPLEIHSSGRRLTEVRLSFDKEQNGMVMFNENGRLRSIRFIHNTAFGEAWGAAETLSASYRDDAYTLLPIKEDGRMLLVFGEYSGIFSNGGYLTFSDYAPDTRPNPNN